LSGSIINAANVIDAAQVQGFSLVLLGIGGVSDGSERALQVAKAGH
jgi:hypothetical protein